MPGAASLQCIAVSMATGRRVAGSFNAVSNGKVLFRSREGIVPPLSGCGLPVVFSGIKGYKLKNLLYTLTGAGVFLAGVISETGILIPEFLSSLGGAWCFSGKGKSPGGEFPKGGGGPGDEGARMMPGREGGVRTGRIGRNAGKGLSSMRCGPALALPGCLPDSDTFLKAG